MKQIENIPKIAVTGTKGKTTTVYVIAQVLQKLARNVLRVDTTGHYLNGEQRSTMDDSKTVWNLVPTVSPGRYLWEFFANPNLADNAVAVLETALGCSNIPGLGYRVHDIGVFLNVFEDHMGATSRLKSRSDIAVAKEFVFGRIARGGVAVCNADDPLVVRSLRVLPQGKDIRILPFGLTFESYDLDKHLAEGGEAVTVAGTNVVLKFAAGERVLLDLTTIPWAFNGTFTPSTWNVMAAAAAVYAQLGEWTDEVRAAFEAVRLDPYGGRLTLLRAANGATILADYAHEKVSLTEVAKLGKQLLGPGGKLIGVVRLAHDRTDEVFRETGEIVGANYDVCVVYDKIDGHLRKPKVVNSSRFPQVVGRTSEHFAAGIRATNPNVERILREDQALVRAAELANPEDVVVVIVNDDIRQSIGFIQQSFKAEFM